MEELTSEEMAEISKDYVVEISYDDGFESDEFIFKCNMEAFARDIIAAHEAKQLRERTFWIVIEEVRGFGAEPIMAFTDKKDADLLAAKSWRCSVHEFKFRCENWAKEVE